MNIMYIILIFAEPSIKHSEMSEYSYCVGKYVSQILKAIFNLSQILSL